MLEGCKVIIVTLVIGRHASVAYALHSPCIQPVINLVRCLCYSWQINIKLDNKLNHDDVMLLKHDKTNGTLLVCVSSESGLSDVCCSWW